MISKWDCQTEWTGPRESDCVSDSELSQVTDRLSVSGSDIVNASSMGVLSSAVPGRMP
jgi:hypothetical protein